MWGRQDKVFISAIRMHHIPEKRKERKIKSGKVVLVLLTGTTPLRHIGGVEVQLHAFLTAALAGGEWPVSILGCFTPRERSSGTHRIGEWVGLRAALVTVVKRKFPAPTGTRTSNHPAHSSAL